MQQGFLDFIGLTIKASFRNMQLSINGSTVNINQGDGNPLFPEDRRCVLFQLGL